MKQEKPISDAGVSEKSDGTPSTTISMTAVGLHNFTYLQQNKTNETAKQGLYVQKEGAVYYEASDRPQELPDCRA
jgi:hypothetical protein